MQSRPVLSWSAVLQSVEDYAEAPDGAQHVLCADGDGLHYVTSVTRTTPRRTPSCRRSASTSILRRTRRCRSVTASSCPTSSGTFAKGHTQSGPHPSLGSGLPDVETSDDFFVQQVGSHSRDGFGFGFGFGSGELRLNPLSEQSHNSEKEQLTDHQCNA